MSTLQIVSNHLWQSTLFAGAVAIVVVVLRGKRASVRHALWLAASIKFAVPFAALTAVGTFIGSRLSLHVPRPAPEFVQTLTAVPFAQAARTITESARAADAETAWLVLPALLGLWIVGGLIVLAAWGVRWMRAARVARTAIPLLDGREVDILRHVEASMGARTALPIRATDAVVEPGVFGMLRPVLLWPRAMSAHLSDEQIETIFIHELSHVRRYDNLAAAAHVLVQAGCWFHPLVWWIGARLVDERERACDEDVVRAGRDRQVYAESLLKTCQLSVGAPAVFVAGVTGSDLKRRLTTIMAAPVGAHLGISARLALIVALAAVIAVPMVNAAAAVAQGTATITLPDPSKTFDAASVRRSAPDAVNSGSRAGNGNLTARNTNLRTLILSAFQLDAPQLVGAPDWVNTEGFDVVAKADVATSDADLKIMAQNMLIQRFSMKVHVETRNLPVYAMVLARADGQLGPNLRLATDSPANAGVVSRTMSSGGGGGAMGFTGRGGSSGATMAFTGPASRIASWLTSTAGRPIIDRTGLEGRYEMNLRYTRPGAPMNDDPAQAAPDFFTAIQEQLGLKLEPTRAPIDVLVIDSAERPVNDDFEMPDPNAR